MLVTQNSQIHRILQINVFNFLKSLFPESNYLQFGEIRDVYCYTKYWELWICERKYFKCPFFFFFCKYSIVFNWYKEISYILVSFDNGMIGSMYRQAIHYFKDCLNNWTSWSSSLNFAFCPPNPAKLFQCSSADCNSL